MEWNWDPEKWRSENKTKSLSTKIVTKFNYRPLTTVKIFHVYDGITWFMTRHQINRSNQRFICEIEFLWGATRGEISCVRRTYFTSRAFVAHHHSNRFFPSLFIIDHYSVFVSLNEIQAEIFVIGWWERNNKTHICRRTINQMQVYCNVAMTKPHFYMLRKVRFSVLHSQCIRICSSSFYSLAFVAVSLSSSSS